MNAHINYDLPQALLAVITDEEFDDPALLTRRRSDHQAIDRVLASRVAAGPRECAYPEINIPDREVSGSRTWRYERGLIRRPAIPPSTASDVPVTDDASGLAR